MHSLLKNWGGHSFHAVLHILSFPGQSDSNMALCGVVEIPTVFLSKDCFTWTLPVLLLSYSCSGSGVQPISNVLQVLDIHAHLGVGDGIPKLYIAR